MQSYAVLLKRGVDMVEFKQNLNAPTVKSSIPRLFFTFLSEDQYKDLKINNSIEAIELDKKPTVDEDILD